MIGSAYIAVMLVGFLHGLEPRHGWPIAFFYSIKKDKPLYYGLLSSSLISICHFVSSMTVVLAYALVASPIDVSTSLMKYFAATILFFLAYKFTEKRWRTRSKLNMGISMVTRRESSTATSMNMVDQENSLIYTDTPRVLR